MAIEEDKCSKALQKKKLLIKEQNNQLGNLTQELKSCYEHSNETAKNLGQLTSSCSNYIDKDKLQESQKDASICEGNGWIIDNIFCPISNKMNQFWEPLPAWGKDAVIATSIAAVGIAGYTLFTTTPQTLQEKHADVLKSVFIAMGRTPERIEKLTEEFLARTGDADPEHMVGIMSSVVQFNEQFE